MDSKKIVISFLSTVALLVTLGCGSVPAAVPSHEATPLPTSIPAATPPRRVPSATATPAPSVVHATLKDMTITLDKRNVPAGSITFTATNQGATRHELVIIRTDVDEEKLAVDKESKADETGDLGEINDLDPGQTGSITLDLAPGHYVLICNIPAHYVAHMHTTLIVTG